MKHILFFGLIVSVLLTSCKKSAKYDPSVKAALSVEFDNIVGGSDLQLTTGSYTNAAGESFTVNKLKYYVSNFKLTNVDGSTYTVPQDDSYFLIDESDATTHEPELEIPEGEYKTLSFTLGVDSLRCTKDISERSGVLDPTATGGDMYWGWNSGYIFFKMEGSSPAAAMGYMYHIGGFGGYSSSTINNIKQITIDLTGRGTAQVKANKETNIHLMVDVLKVFNGAANVSIATNSMVMFSAFSTTVANNYTVMFQHDHTEN
ncbi:MbnP family protein [Ferruginibacter sp. SUN002]|uniref:MbnP family protein n=1 Tax=Ferruginibacter sp. SUN002 TaxID=2937789 RepID=UPI003D360D04